MNLPCKKYCVCTHACTCGGNGKCCPIKRSRQAIKHAGTHAYYPNRYIQSLLEQAITLRKQVQEVLPHASPEQANALYDEHVRIMNQLLTKLNDVDIATLENYFMQVEYDEQTKKEIVPPELLAKQKQLQAAGLQYADAGEGMAMITIVPDYYATLFGKQLSPDYHAYVAIQAEHNKQTSIKDGGLAISYDDFGKRLG